MFEFFGDAFDQWARPEKPMSAFIERIVGTTNERLARCPPSAMILKDFLDFIHDAELTVDDFDLQFVISST